MNGEPAWLRQWRQRAGERWWWPLAGALLFAAGGVLWASLRSEPRASPVAGVPSAPDTAAPPTAAALPASVPGAAPASPGAAPGGAERDAGAAPSPTVKVVFRTFPGRRAVVMWGSKRLGFIDRNAPLVVERPRDSGPLDVVIRAPDYVPVHTRAYTFNDSTIDVRITPVEKKDTIYGYKEPLPPDGGVPFPGEATEIPE